jgi:hypothetical protein
MFPLKSDKATVVLLPSGILHVTFEEGGILTAQLSRELYVMSKMKFKEPVKAIVITIPDTSDPGNYYCKTCKKVKRVQSGIPIAVVCSQADSKKEPGHCQKFNRMQDSFGIFGSFGEALSWIHMMLNAKVLQTSLNQPPENMQNLLTEVSRQSQVMLNFNTSQKK